MKSLVVYYSRTGITKTVAEAVKQALSSDIEDIHDSKTRTGVLGWMGAGRDATLKRATPIATTSVSPGDYDLVIVGTPVWAFTMSSPVRTWLSEHGRRLKRAAFFCTMGGTGDNRTFRHMEELSLKPVATMTLIDKDVRKGAFAEKVKLFLDALPKS